MKKGQRSHLGLGFLGAALTVLLVVALACGGDDTATPAPTAAPARTAVPVPTTAPVATVAPAPTAAPVAEAGPVYGGILKFAGSAGPTNFDPNHSIGVRGRYTMHALYDKLVRYSPTFEIIPGAASSWEFSADGKSITFHLREGIKFHDGTDLNAEAVKWNLDHQKDPETLSRNRTELTSIERVEVVDNNTVTLHLSAANRPLMASLGDRGGMLISPTAFQKLGEDYGANPVGSGPFKFKEWVIDSHVIIERNENYWETGLPYMDEVRLQDVSDQSISFAMLRTGEADMIVGVRGSDLPIIDSNPNLKTALHESGRFYAIQLAVDTPPWDNLALRQALAYSVDRETLLRVYYEDLGRVAGTPVGTGWAHNPQIMVYSYDPQKAREKLVEAGYSNGITADLHCSSSAPATQLCEIIQAQAVEVGINLNIIPIRSSDQSRLTLERTQLMRMTSWSPRADPGVKINILFNSEASQNKFHGYNNPEVDRLMAEAAAIYDINVAKPIYDQIQRIVAEEGPYIYNIWKNEVIAMTKRVQDFEWIPDLMIRFRPLWLKQ